MKVRLLALGVMIIGVAVAGASDGRLVAARHRDGSLVPHARTASPYSGWGMNVYANELAAGPSGTVETYMQNAGVAYVRLNSYWALYQPDNLYSPGNPGWDNGYKAMIAAAVAKVHNAGMYPVLSIQGAPCWAQNNGCTATDNAPLGSGHVAEFQSFIETLATDPAFAYVQYWSIANEPNSQMSVHEGAPWNSRLYVVEQMANAAGPKLHLHGKSLIGPDIVARFTDTTSGYATGPWLTNFLAATGSNVDIVTVHDYAGSPSTIDNDMLDFVWRTSGRQVWLTEGGPDDPFITDGPQKDHLIGLYSAMFSRQASGSLWAKTFLWHMTQNDPAKDTRGIVHNAYSGSPTFRPAYLCYYSYSSFGAPSC